MEGIIITQNTPSFTKAPKSNLRKIVGLLSIQLRPYSYFREFSNCLQQEFMPGTMESKMTHLEAAMVS